MESPTGSILIDVSSVSALERIVLNPPNKVQHMEVATIVDNILFKNFIVKNPFNKLLYNYIIVCGRFQHKITKTETGSYICGNSHISQGVKFVGNSVIGEGCYIGKNVTLENCILWDGVEVADNICMKDCVIASNSRVDRNLTNHIIGQNERIAKFNSKHKKRLKWIKFWRKVLGRK